VVGSFPIVGIGASAGGLEAFKQFFKYMPSDSGIAFVLLPHLDPGHSSMTPGLLRRFTRMPVVEAEDNMRVLPNRVYIIPPNKDMAVCGGTLNLTDPQKTRGLRMAAVRDVTQQQKLNQLMRQGQKLGALGTLAGGIAHDFNNILMPIVLNTEMALLNLPQQSAVRPYLDLTLAAAFRGKDLIKQIITFSRQKEQVRRPLRVVPLVKEALDFLESSLPRTIEIKRSIQDNLEDTILGDPSQVHQIIMNLCTNAAQAMRQKTGVVEVSLVEENLDYEGTLSIPDLGPGKYLKLTVRDTGSGMSPEVLERVFDPFFTTKQQAEGRGMGLAVVRGIVGILGGVVTARSEPGVGSTFAVYLPRAEAAPLSIEPEVEKLAAGKGHILVVDDEKVQLETYLNVLKRLGYEVEGETDSAQALIRFRENIFAYDLIITDQTMPKISGLRLAEEMLRLRPGIPIVLCTGYSEVVDAELARAAGIKEFILKPFTVREIAAVVRRVLSRP
jgi:signal transduction histidine kinase